MPAAADPQTTRYAYRRVAEELRRAIAVGTYPAGSHLPSESDLMARYCVSRGTIRQTFAQLQSDGTIASRQGSRRTVITAPKPEGIDDLITFSRWVRAAGREPSARMLRLVERPATRAEELELGLGPGAMVVRTLRLLLVAGVPTLLQRASYAEAVGRVIAATDTDDRSITDLLAEHGHPCAAAEHTLDAIGATGKDARLLDVAKGDSMLRVRRRTADPTGTPIEWSDNRYRPGSVAYAVTTTGGATRAFRVLAGDR